MLSPTFPEVHLPHLADTPIPPMLRVRLTHPKGGPIADIAGAVDEALARSKRLADLPSDASVAVAVGSRGIAHIPEVVAAAVHHLKQRGFAPFIVPAMGSHGGATAEGQAGVLAHLGVTEQTVGAPVRATMETVEYGATLHGIPCRFDKNAAEADAVLCINRVKSHTSFDRPVESGLTKLIAVGLGKQVGAQNVHRLGPRGYVEVLPQLARIAIDHSPIAYGIALVENADEQLVVIEGVEPDSFAAADERLLKVAKSLIARLPFEHVDGLIVEWIGKEISGAGMDPAVVGRVGIRSVPDPGKPFVNKLAVLGVTEDSYGNAIGLGNADYTTRKVANHIDLLADVHELDHRGGHRKRPDPGGAGGRSDRDPGHGRDLLAERSRERAPVPDPLDPAPARDPGLAGALRRHRRPAGRRAPVRPGAAPVLRDGDLLTRV